MFCPSCGVKNEGSPLKCFVCGFILPSSEPRAAAADPRRRRPTLSAATTEPFAAIGDRMLALILDRVFLAALLTVPAAFLAQRSSSLDLRGAIVTGVSLLAAILVYHVILEALFGATLGKGLLGLQVRTASDDGRWMAALIRNIARVLDSLLFYAVAFLAAAFTKRRQRIGDLLAGTTVIEQRVPWGARVALIFIWVALVAGALWTAAWLCPACVPDRSRLPFPSHI